MTTTDGSGSAPLGSPIEIDFAAGVADHGGMKFVPKFGLTYEEVRTEAPKLLKQIDSFKDVVVFPQVRIAKYTVDFRAMFWDCRNLIMPIAVECDGHDFHERTRSKLGTTRGATGSSPPIRSCYAVHGQRDHTRSG